jgi:hypothetical protein
VWWVACVYVFTIQRCIIPDVAVPVALGASERVSLKPGDYVSVRIASAHVQTLQGEPIARSSITDFQRYPEGALVDLGWAAQQSRAESRLSGAVKH